VTTSKVKSRAAELLLEVSLSFKRTLARAAAEEGLSAAQAALLWELVPGEAMAMSAVADVLECAAGNVTVLADKLEQRGLVGRFVGQADRRVKLLMLTSEGQQARTRLAAKLLAPPYWLAALSGADQIALCEIFERAKDAVGGVRLDDRMERPLPARLGRRRS
jgi:DNA-binding MarR family transcriptional regulator